MNHKLTFAALCCALFATQARASLLPAQGFFPESSDSYPANDVPDDVDYWSAGIKTVHCVYVENALTYRIEIVIDNNTHDVVLRKQLYTGNPPTWQTQETQNTQYHPGQPTTVTFEGFVVWFGTSGSDSPPAFSSGPVIAFGFAGDDIITGSDKGDFLFGGEGADELMGGGGADELWGGPGDDTLHGEDGHDQLHLADGVNQYAYGGLGSDTIYGGPGEDVLVGHLDPEDEVAFIVDDADVIYTEGGGDDVYGGPDSDTIYVAASQDKVVISGGGGSDTIRLYGNKGTIYGDYKDSSNWDESHQGIDQLYIFGSTDPGDDPASGGALTCYTIRCGEFGDTVHNGGDYNDEIHGEDGIDNINAGAGDDEVYGGAGGDYIWGNTGSDTIYGDDKNHSVSGDDHIWGGLDGDTIYGGQGSDRIAGDNGDNALDGGGDTIFGDGDSVPWGAKDVIWGEGGEDYLYGGIGNDKLHGGPGEDFLNGEVGDDTLIDRTDGKVDFLDGGPGIDTLDSYNGIGATDPADVLVGADGQDSFYKDDHDLDDYDLDEDNNPKIESSLIDPLSW